jgi:hypothetical protein
VSNDTEDDQRRRLTRLRRAYGTLVEQRLGFTPGGESDQNVWDRCWIARAMPRSTKSGTLGVSGSYRGLFSFKS